MRAILLAASAAALVLAAPALAQGNGNGGGGAPGKGKEAKAGPAKGGDDRGGGNRAQASRGNDGNAHKEKAVERGGDRGPPAPAHKVAGNGGPDRKPGRGPDRQTVRPETRADRSGPGRVDMGQPEGRPGTGGQSGPPSGAKAGRDSWREDTRLFADRTWDGKRYRYDDRAYLVPTASWCPPGLAKKGNGCMPPGQARKLDRYDGWSDWYPVRHRDDGYDWRYGEGYLYRVGNGGLVSALIPLIGGALFGGQVWPQQYNGYDAPDYYDRFYGYDEGYDYRVAQNAIFAVDPNSGQIDGIAGLLTGDRWSVGQRMPVGYDVYNVPPTYRDRYTDRDDAMYRYSDGYVYEVDPTTQLVRTVMELLV